MTKRLVLLVVTGALMAALVATAAFAQTGREDNVEYGTIEGEVIYGTYGVDFINGLEGDDLLVGEAGADIIDGGPGNDFLVAAYGYWQAAPYAPASPDYIQGGVGDDLIDSADLAGAPDTVQCGEGDDLVYAGVEDNVAADCEFVYRYYGY